MCEEYIGKEMPLSDIRKKLIDKWVIAEVTGKTDRLRPIGKVIVCFDNEKEMHLMVRQLNNNGDARHLAVFRGAYGLHTPKPRFERVVPYEDY